MLNLHSIKIEPARQDDAASISNVALRAAPLQFNGAQFPMSGEDMTETWSTSAISSQLGKTDSTILVARNASDKLLALGQVCIPSPCPYIATEGNTKWASIDMLYVDPTVHHGGVRTSLLYQLGVLAKQNGAERTWLVVLGTNTPAFRLYEKGGYAVVSDTGFGIEDGLSNDKIMAKDL